MSSTPTVTSTMEKIGPAEAHKLLSNHPKNRRLSRARADGLARDMKDGRWVFDGQPIRIDTEGSLVDGQHRLNAVITADVEIEFLVVRGVPTESMATMDTGKSRSFSDILTIEDETLTDTNNLAAATRILYLWDKGVRGRSLSSAGNQDQRQTLATQNNLLTYFREHRDEIVETTREAIRLKRSVAGVNVSALSLTTYVLTGIDVEDAQHFFNRLGDGAGLEPLSPILALRKRFQDSAIDRERLPTFEAVALMFKAWNYYREGKPLQILAWKQGGAHPEGFPEPK